MIAGQIAESFLQVFQRDRQFSFGAALLAPYRVVSLLSMLVSYEVKKLFHPIIMAIPDGCVEYEIGLSEEESQAAYPVQK